MPVYTDAYTVPANTPEETPVEVTMVIEEQYVTDFAVYFPIGCAGLAHAQVYYGSEQLAPKPTGSSFIGNDLLVHSPAVWKCPDYPHTELTWKLWNLDDTYGHTPILYIAAENEPAVKPYLINQEILDLLKEALFGE